MTQPAQYVDVLTTLTESGKARAGLKGNFAYQRKDVAIRVDPDGEELATTLRLAKKFLSGLEGYDARAKQKVAEEMLQNYNDNWRQEHDPVLTANQFIQKLTLVGMSFLGSDSVDFSYDDADMFAGHSLIPQSFDGETFTYVRMYG
ncbi:MAG: DUF2262 domain-containing protein [Pseudomonadota bacterium]